MTNHKCIRIEFEYDDGELWRTEGEDAETIRQQIDDQAVMRTIHGRPYKGPFLKLVCEEPKP